MLPVHWVVLFCSTWHMVKRFLAYVHVCSREGVQAIRQTSAQFGLHEPTNLSKLNGCYSFVGLGSRTSRARLVLRQYVCITVHPSRRLARSRSFHLHLPATILFYKLFSFFLPHSTSQYQSSTALISIRLSAETKWTRFQTVFL